MITGRKLKMNTYSKCPIDLVVRLFKKKGVIEILRDLFFGKSRFLRQGGNYIQLFLPKRIFGNYLLHRYLFLFSYSLVFYLCDIIKKRAVGYCQKPPPARVFNLIIRLFQFLL